MIFKASGSSGRWHSSDCCNPNLCNSLFQHTIYATQGVSDPEKKRKVIGAGFIRVFDEFATKLKSEDRIKPRFLVQVVTHRRSYVFGFCGTHISIGLWTEEVAGCDYGKGAH